MDFTTLTTEDKLLIARDALRGRESDYFRLSMLDESSVGGPDRLRVMEAEIETIRAEVEKLEQELEKKREADEKAARRENRRRSSAQKKAGVEEPQVEED